MPWEPGQGEGSDASEPGPCVTEYLLNGTAGGTGYRQYWLPGARGLVGPYCSAATTTAPSTVGSSAGWY